MMPDKPSMKPGPFDSLYDMLIPKTHVLRQIKELVDFSFVAEELETKYCLDNGRTAIHPIRMFKYLFLKCMYPLSDVDLVERSHYDMSFKYFLDMAPEEDVIHPSSLTKFRKLRLSDSGLLELLIGKTVALAMAHGLVETGTIIVDATHTSSRYQLKKPKEVLQDQSRLLRKQVYAVDTGLKTSLPSKNTRDEVEAERRYCEDLIAAVEQVPHLPAHSTAGEALRLWKETVADDLESLSSSYDSDARLGHKSVDSSFFGYKTHLAMTPERIIMAAVVTTGEKGDSKFLSSLIEQSDAAGIAVDTVIGDRAYSGKENLQDTKDRGICLVARLHPITTHGTRTKENLFDFNKDAGMYVCPAGHMAIRKARQGRKGAGKNQRETYYFDIERCKRCPLREGCYTEGAKSKTYSVTLHSTEHAEQAAFQETEAFKQTAKERYKMETKNSELKNRHGYHKASGTGLDGMALQGAMSIFVVNIKRILHLVGT